MGHDQDRLLILLTCLPQDPYVSGDTIGRRVGMDLLLCLPAFLILTVFYGTIKSTLCIERENRKICLLAALFLLLYDHIL